MRAERSTLLTFAAAVLLPLLLFVALASAFSLQAQRREIEADAQERAAHVTGQVEAALAAERTALEILSQSTTLIARDYALAYQRFYQVADTRAHWRNLVLTDAAGRQVFQTASPLGAPVPARPDVAAFLATGPTAFTVAGISGQARGCPCLVLHQPVVHDGRLTHVLTLELDPKGLQQILLDDHSPGGVSAIVDAEGRFLARTLDYQAKVGQPATRFVREAIKTGDQGLYRGRTYEGLENYTAFKTSGTTGLSTHVAIGAGQVNQPQQRFTLLLVLAGMLALSLAAAIGAFGLAQLSRRRREDEGRRQAEKLQAIGQLCGGVAHDFNNLLAVIIGNLDHLEKKASPETRRGLTNALAAAQRAAKLVEQLLAFTRDEGPDIADVDVSAVVDGVRDLIAQAVGAGASVSVDIAPDARFVRSNASELALTLLNLAVNARDAMPDGGEIAIASRRNGAMVELSVRDTGHGMSAKVAAQALEPFYTTKPPGKGTGLGLAQVQKLAKHSGGTVHIKTAEGAGCTVTITLPAAAN